MEKLTDYKKSEAVALMGEMSWRKIAHRIDVPRSTLSDYLRGLPNVEGGDPFYRPFPNLLTKVKPTVVNIVTEMFKSDGCNHYVIPDTQCKAGIPLDYLSWIGRDIANRKPNVIIHLGDHADMESLSSYDKGKKAAEGKRVSIDIQAAICGMEALLKPIQDLQNHEYLQYGEVLYKPRMILCLGNHEERIVRHVNANPELSGFLSYDNLRYKEMGWEVIDFLKPIIVNGVTYCHYMANPMSGKPYGGSVLNILKNVGESFTVGHKQTLDIATRFLPASGKQQWAIVAGSAYMHEEDYKGYQGNKHWRGVISKQSVVKGSYNPTFISLKSLKELYGV